MQTTEQRLERLEKHNRRLTTALTMTVVAMCAVVTMAATGMKRGDFDVVTAQAIFVINEAGMPVVGLGSTDFGHGTVTTYQPNGKELVELGASDSGGVINVHNKTDEVIATMGADEYGNGVVWAGNRKGMGRTLQPGP